ncbi:hypothetical protein BCV71DRAFT_187776 [Rhizopus microsporus]|uniref:Uncharacterized protein n=1 Tax=Rhizopus microsporus TaxID=58291 RepID=A0A1X0RQL5_RHIZD|nr:hypothetical protein BCV71DRAFT_187776 [Rhizopus microsporus]
MIGSCNIFDLDKCIVCFSTVKYIHRFILNSPNKQLIWKTIWDTRFDSPFSVPALSHIFSFHHSKKKQCDPLLRPRPCFCLTTSLVHDL